MAPEKGEVKKPGLKTRARRIQIAIPWGPAGSRSFGGLLCLIHMAAANIWKKTLGPIHWINRESYCLLFPDKEVHRGLRDRLRTTQLMTNFKSKPKSIRLHGFALFSGPQGSPAPQRESREMDAHSRCVLDPFAGRGASRRFSRAAPSSPRSLPNLVGVGGRRERSHPLRLQFPRPALARNQHNFL